MVTELLRRIPLAGGMSYNNVENFANTGNPWQTQAEFDRRQAELNVMAGLPAEGMPVPSPTSQTGVLNPKIQSRMDNYTSDNQNNLIGAPAVQPSKFNYGGTVNFGDATKQQGWIWAAGAAFIVLMGFGIKSALAPKRKRR